MELMWNPLQPVSETRASFLLNLCPDNRSIRLAASHKSLGTETIMCPASSNVALICPFHIKIIVIVDVVMKRHDFTLESWIYFK